MGKILIQAQFPPECTLLVDSLEKFQIATLAGADYYVSDDLIIGMNGMGEINAAMQTALAIKTFSPTLVINQGIAGAHDPVLHCGDVVIAKEVVNINANKTPFKGEGEGSNALEWKPYEVVDRLALKPKERLLKTAIQLQGHRDEFKVVTGVFASGDIWNNELDRIRLFRNEYGSSCEEMETFAVAQTCEALGVPWLGIRSISNSVVTKEEYHPEYAVNAQKIALEFLRLFREK